MRSLANAPNTGWTRVHDGATVRLGRNQERDLLRLAESKFDLFITADQNIRYQQNLAGRRIPILELSTNKLRCLTAAAALIQSTIATIRPGDFRHLAIP